jgi:hypothetical protein
MYSGSCLCREVRYEFDAEPRACVACHCSNCRKVTGSAFAIWALVPMSAFRWLSGHELITEFRSSDHGQRFFCRRCGSTLGNLSSERPNLMHLACGTLDRAPNVRIMMHVYAASKAPWFELDDGAPQFDEMPPRK